VVEVGPTEFEEAVFLLVELHPTGLRVERAVLVDL